MYKLNHQSRILFLLFSLLWACNHSIQEATVIQLETFGKYRTKNVIMVVIDGPRFKETWGDPTKKYIPHIANELASVGINHNRFYNRGATYTTSGHTAITTGYYQWMANDGSEIPFYPSIFQGWLSNSRANPNQAQVITSKKKLDVLTDCTEQQWRGKFNPSVDALDRDDAETLQVVLSKLEQDHPQLLLVHFRGPDWYGHAKDWGRYLNSIAVTDQYTYEIWQFLQNDPFYKDKTTFLVTNDHGRHNDTVRDGYVSHGDFCEGCMHINLYATGPDFKTNMIANKPRESVDIAPTVAELLGFEQPYSSGSIMWELFKEK